jgi:hypothetical protein
VTTILADFHLGLMVCDSNVSDEDRVWIGRKVWRIGRALIGMAGADPERAAFLDWYRGGLKGHVKFKESAALILTPSGLYHYDSNYAMPQKVESGREAIGTGSKAAMCTHEALGFQDPRQAVKIVCRHDASSRGPVRSYKLKR